MYCFDLACCSRSRIFASINTPIKLLIANLKIMKQSSKKALKSSYSVSLKRTLQQSSSSSLTDTSMDLTSEKASSVEHNYRSLGSKIELQRSDEK